jgi:small subunit ribosomal protein S16
MSRGGRKGRPFYKIVVADKRARRDGRFLEKLGTFDPLLAETNERRVVLNEERIKYWLSQGAQPSDRVARFLGKAGIIEMPKWNDTPKKSAPSDATVQRRQAKTDKQEAAVEAAKAAEEAAKAAEAEAREAAAAAAAAPAPAEEPAPEAAPETAPEAAAEAPEATAPAAEEAQG